MIRSGCVGFAALLATTVLAQAQTSVERGAYLVNTIMTCNNCHTPMGPNGPQFDRALSGGLRFDEPPFDVTASNITPDVETGIGSWKEGDIKKALQDAVRPDGTHLAEVMPTGFYKILTPGDLDGIVAYLRSIKPVSHKVPAPVYKMQIPHQVFPGAEKPMSDADLSDKVKRGSLTHAGNAHLRRQLIESAWAYTTGPSLGPTLKRRQEGISAETQARAWASQVDLCRRFKALDKRKSVRGVVIAAIARRLAGHLHAEMVA